ncbi:MULTISPECIES: PTS sugar transporter subunit IIA [Bacillus]|uniref:PTS sugar transporter subunit IIA n=1 Tax=Bacillus TaxID=1386 RepID=UPI000427FB1D|nr:MULTISPECIES: PTS sugar transporter subunit IIA [Bacillus]QHZ45064.1 PTS sugar transporter subunit IIA [Bacillus sp. NSP9.1]WFA05135.1 PTS sugar transporter subunit IIA [Bacillus sp. HSf4]
MNEADLFKEELIFTDIHAQTPSELLTEIGCALEQLGYVEKSFTGAIIERERQYPTGLALPEFSIGLPHTDARHVKQAFIAVVKNDQKLPFIHMGTEDQEVDIDCFFVLGVKDPCKQVKVLQLLIEKLNDSRFVRRLKTMDEKKQLFTFLKQTVQE